MVHILESMNELVYHDIFMYHNHAIYGTIPLKGTSSAYLTCFLDFFGMCFCRGSMDSIRRDSQSSSKLSSKHCNLLNMFVVVWLSSILFVFYFIVWIVLCHSCLVVQWSSPFLAVFSSGAAGRIRKRPPARHTAGISPTWEPFWEHYVFFRNQESCFCQLPRLPRKTRKISRAQTTDKTHDTHKITFIFQRPTHDNTMTKQRQQRLRIVLTLSIWSFNTIQSFNMRLVHG